MKRSRFSEEQIIAMLKEQEVGLITGVTVTEKVAHVWLCNSRMIIARAYSFSEWATVFGDAKMTDALLDRLVRRKSGCWKSERLRQATRRVGETPKDDTVSLGHPRISTDIALHSVHVSDFCSALKSELPRKLAYVSSPSKFSHMTLKTTRNGTATSAPATPHSQPQTTTVRKTATAFISRLRPTRVGVRNCPSIVVRIRYTAGAARAYVTLSNEVIANTPTSAAPTSEPA